MALCLSLCVCLSQVGVLSKRLNKSGWFLARELPLTYPTVCNKEISYVVCYFRDVYPFIYFIIATYVHHLGLYCILFSRFLISKLM